MLRDHPFRSVGHSFVAYCVLWTLIESSYYLLSLTKKNSSCLFAIMVLVSITWGLIQSWRLSKITINVRTTNTKIEVLFGDLFEQPGLRAIAVTEYFETEIGTPVSKESLHGTFLSRFFEGRIEDLDLELEKQLGKITPAKIDAKKVKGKTTDYPIGATALIYVGNDKYIVFALAKADPETCKAYAGIAEMWSAMHGLWKRARDEAGGLPLNVPLIGSGLSGIGLPERELLNLIILSAITETKMQQITQRIRIVLHPKGFNEIDLREVKTYWENA